jgi:hypothetical protein
MPSTHLPPPVMIERTAAVILVTHIAKALDYLLSLESEERPSGSDYAQAQPLSVKDFELLQGFFDRRRANISPPAQPPNARLQQRPKTEKDKK